MAEPTLDEQVVKIRIHVADERVTEIHANCCRKLLRKIDELLDRNELLEADAAHWRPELTARAEELESTLQSIRPKADCYDRVCQSLGIGNDILGYCKGRQGLVKELQACLRRYVAAAEKDHFPGKDAENEAARLLKS